MADYTPLYVPGGQWTATASATITGGQALEVSGSDTVAPTSGASAKYVGFAAFDAVNGQKVLVRLAKAIHETTASGAITAGDQLVTAAAGKVSTLAAASGAAASDINSARSVIGVALSTATDGNKVRWIER